MLLCVGKREGDTMKAKKTAVVAIRCVSLPYYKPVAS